MRSLKYILLQSIIISLLVTCKPTTNYDLAIENVKIFDVYSGEVIENKTILVNNSTIESIINSGEEFNAYQVIEGNGRLVTPGFIDTHIHLTDMYGDYENAPKFLSNDSLNYYRNQLTETYLNYGTTTVVDMGQPENWMSVTSEWQKNPTSKYPNLFITGGAMISDEEREPYINHTEVASLEEAEQKVQDYNELGLKHLKLYWRLRAPEMKAVVNQAQQLDMKLYAHIDQNIVSVDDALNMGINNFEHLLSIALSVFNYKEHYEALMNKFEIPEVSSADEFIALRVLIFKYIKEDPQLHKKFEDLLSRLAKEEASLSTTIHLLGSVAERTYFTTSAAKISDVTAEVLPRYSIENKKTLDSAFTIAMEYLRTAHNKGVKIRIGTDCREGGKAMLSELLLLKEAGFTVEEILQIATINGAEALFLNEELGSIEEGKRAGLLIFDQNPFEDFHHLMGNKMIIKDGKLISGF